MTMAGKELCPHLIPIDIHVFHSILNYSFIIYNVNMSNNDRLGLQIQTNQVAAVKLWRTLL